MAETVPESWRALARPLPLPAPPARPVRGTPGGWRDRWDDPDPALAARAEALADAERDAAAVARERAAIAAERAGG